MAQKRQNVTFPDTYKTLTRKQIVAAQAFARTGSDSKSAIVAKCDRHTIWKWRQDPIFQEYLNKINGLIARRFLQKLYAREDAVFEAFDAALTLCDDDNQVGAASVRYKAAKDILDKLLSFRENIDFEGRLLDSEGDPKDSASKEGDGSSGMAIEDSPSV